MGKSKKHQYIFYFTILFFSLFWLWIASQIPYTHDDWDWGLDIGIQHLLTADINSRYAGNFIEILLTRSQLLKTIVLGITYTGIPYLCTVIAGKILCEESFQAKSLSYIAANCLMMVINAMIWQQTIGWVAGAANFVISGLLLLIYIYILCLHYSGSNEESAKGKKALSLLHFLFGIIIQLFIENITVVITASTAIAAGYCIIRKKKCKKTLWLLAGNIIGLIIMFSSPVYSSLLSTGSAMNAYRATSFGIHDSAANLIKNCCQVFVMRLLPYIWIKRSFHFCVMIFLVFSYLALNHLMNTPHRIRAAAINLSAAFLLTANYGLKIESYFPEGNTGYYLYTLGINLFIFITGLYDSRHIAAGKDARTFLSCIWCGIPLVILPLCVTTENGPRLFITSNILIILFLSVIICYSYSRLSDKAKRASLLLAFFPIIFLCAKWSTVYLSIGQCTVRRMNAIEEAKVKGDTSVFLEQYPYTEYILLPDPKGKEKEEYFLQFYGIPESIEVRFESREHGIQ